MVDAGAVTAMAVMGEVLFAAGDFRNAGGRPAASLARFSFGRWAAMAGSDGVRSHGGWGQVHILSILLLEPQRPSSMGQAMQAPCLFVGGDFDRIGSRAHPGLTYLCNPAQPTGNDNATTVADWQTVAAAANDTITFAMIQEL